MTPRKKLIEVSIPLEAINKASAREKSIRHGHPSTLHLWWARRPLAACRAVLFAQLVDDPSAWPDRFPDEATVEAERARLHKVIERLVPWEASNDEGALRAARWEIARSVAWGRGEEPPDAEDGAGMLRYLQEHAPPVYDPFSGGGSIPLEAQRLGLRAHGSDLNPVAVLIGKALVEIPPKFAGRPPVNSASRAALPSGGWRGAAGLAADVRHYGAWMREEAARRIGHLYPKAALPGGGEATVIAWLWARTVRSPDPAARGAMVPLVSSFLLSTKEGRKAWAEVMPDAAAPDGWRFEVRSGALSKADEERLKKGTKTGRGSNFACVLTGAAISPDHVKSEGVAGCIGTRLMAVVADGTRERVYLGPTPDHEATAACALPEAVPDGELPDDPRNFWTVQYGLTTFASLFTPRQLTALTTFSDLVGEARERALVDARATGLPDDPAPLHTGGTGAAAYADAVVTYLAFAVSKVAPRSCSLTIWEVGMGRLAAALGRQALPMQWSFAETNPIGGAGGDIGGTAASVAENLDNLGFGAPGEIRNLAAQASGSVSLPVVVSTDPPYYDNIGYADLSDFFYVWLRRSLATTWPDLFRRLTTPKDAELVATPYRHGGRDAAEAFFMQGMGEALAAMRKAASNDAPLAIIYAFKQSETGNGGTTSAGWASFLQAIASSGLLVDGTWPLRTEATNALKAGINALASSIVLVCRKRPDDAPVITRAEFVRALRRELPPAVAAIRRAGVGPVDMQQAVIGPGMGVFTRHARVLEDDDSAMPVRTALSLINRAWDEIENEATEAMDAPTQVALAWFAAYGMDARPAGDLITLANAKNVGVNALFAAGVFHDGRGRASLLPRDALAPGWSPATDKMPTAWECVQHAIRVLNAPDGGAEAAAALVAAMGPLAEPARALAYHLFQVATERGWAAEALAYNNLAEEWPRLLDMVPDAASLAARGPASARQAEMFGA